jgi:thiol:disulfide interchange protein DsbD
MGDFMGRIVKTFAVFLFMLFSLHAYAAISFESPFRVEWDKTPLKIKPGEKFETTVTIHVPPDHYIYADKTDIEFTSLEGIRVDDIKFPATEEKQDPYFNQLMKIYTGSVPITIAGHIPESSPEGIRELSAVLFFQGCTPKLCLRPEEHEIAFNIEVEKAEEKPAEEVSPALKEARKISAPAEGIWKLLKTADFSEILNRGFLVTILIVFLAGVLISLTPCIWPVIPVVLMVIGVEAGRKWWRNVLLSCVLVAGMVVVNAILGLAAVALGKNLGFLFQQKWFLILVVLFFLIMSLSMFGLFDFIPLKRFGERISRLGGKGFRGSFLAGVGIGLISSPCASPVLAALLGYVTLNRSYILGFSLLIVFGLGMGLFFIVMASFFGELAGRLRGGKWMVRVKQLLGILLLLPAIFYMRSLVRWDGVFRPGHDLERPRVEWILSHEEGLKFAKNSGRPVMIEFYADWCPPCRALDSKFFRREDIIRISYQLVPVRLDATVSSSEVENAVEQYRVVGWPTIVFLSPHGEVYGDLTVVSFDPEKIEANMREAIARSRGGS